MRAIDFYGLPNFTYAEIVLHYRNKGFTFSQAQREVGRLKKSFFIKLQKVRTQIDRPIKINCLTEGRHGRGSFHYLAMAGDWRVGGKGRVNYNKVLQACIDAGFKGIGWYPHWKPGGGFHTDIRSGGIKLWLRGSRGIYRGLI